MTKGGPFEIKSHGFWDGCNSGSQSYAPSLVFYAFVLLFVSELTEFRLADRVDLWPKRKQKCHENPTLCFYTMTPLSHDVKKGDCVAGWSFVALRNHLSENQTLSGVADCLLHCDWWISISVYISLLYDIIQLETCLQTHEVGWGRQRHFSAQLLV